MPDDVQLDPGYLGVIAAGEPGNLPPGYGSDARNLRLVKGRYRSRPGVWKPNWLHRVAAGAIKPYGTIHGVGQFLDPNSVAWTIVCADGGVCACKINEPPYSVKLPANYYLTGRVRVVQAFDRLYLFRGRYPAPLRCDALGTGFADCWAAWDSTAAYAIVGTEVQHGPWQTIPVAGSLTSVGSVATLNTGNYTSGTPHGLASGQEVTVQGATPSAYNVRATITVLDEFTFTYTFAGGASPATGTIKFSPNDYVWVTNAVTSAGEEPGVSSKWDRVFTKLPNSDLTVFAQNRLWVATSYNPVLGTYGQKVDYLVSTDYQDELHYDLNDVERVNAGDADTIVALVALPNNQLVVVKQTRCAVLYGAALNLVDLSVDTKAASFGATGQYACAQVGPEVWFLASEHGIMGLRLTSLSEWQGVNEPFSAPVRNWTDRIYWEAAGKAALAWWDSKLYAAVPFDGAIVVGHQCVPLSASYSAGLYSLTTLRAGQRYRFESGVNDASIETGGATYTDGQEFIAGPSALLHQVGGAGSVVTASVVAIYRNANTAVLVYDFVNKAWVSVDTGKALVVRQWFPVYDGARNRLGFEGEDGYLSIMDELFLGDQVPDVDSDSGLAQEAVAMDFWTRGYSAGIGAVRPRGLRVVLGVHDAQYTVTLEPEGVEESQMVVNPEAPDPTIYRTPWDAAPWDPTNWNDDFHTPGRQDYSINLGAAPVSSGSLVVGKRYYVSAEAGPGSVVHNSVTYTAPAYFVAANATYTVGAGSPTVYGPGGYLVLGNHGVNLGLLQDTIKTIGLRGANGRAVRVRISNSQGAIELRGTQWLASPVVTRAETRT